MQRSCVALTVCTLSDHVRLKERGGGGCESAERRIVRDPGAVLHFPRSQGSQTSLLACVAHWFSFTFRGARQHLSQKRKDEKLCTYIEGNFKGHHNKTKSDESKDIHSITSVSVQLHVCSIGFAAPASSFHLDSVS